ncbi:MAG: hypothetical protein ACE5GL_03355 [Calditrichia bacterium]
MREKRYELMKLHYTERNLIALIRKLQTGELLVKAQNGRPMMAEIYNKKRVALNQENGNE